MKWIILVLFLSGCTVVLWSKDVTVFQDTGIGDDEIEIPKRLKNVTTK